MEQHQGRSIRSQRVDQLPPHGHESDDRDAADALAERLGDLPLAIAQAAATARHKDLSLARYLKRLKSRGEELVIRPIPGDEYTDDVATVLRMAVEAAVDSMKNGTKQMLDASWVRSRCLRNPVCPRGGLTPPLSTG